MSGVSGYAALNARVRSLNSSLLSPQEFGKLSDAPDFPALIGLLKQTSYASFIEAIKEKEVTPRRVNARIQGRLSAFYYSLVSMAPESARPILKQMYRYFEVQNLKAVLRGVGQNASWEQMRDVLFPMEQMTVLPAQAMMESGSVTAAVELLQNTPYYETLSFAMKRFSAEGSLFPIEVALDLHYWRQLWSEAKRMQGADLEHASKLVGSLMDMNNLMWVIRYRVYHNLSEEELINYTLPFGYRVRDEDVRAIAAGADIAGVVQRIYPEITDAAALLENPHNGLPKLEMRLKQSVLKQCHAAFSGSPFHIGVPLAFLILSGFEIQDLTVLLEAKASLMPQAEYAPFILKAAVAV